MENKSFPVEVCGAETWTMIHSVPHRSISHIPGGKSLSGYARWTAYWKTVECGGMGGQFHTSSGEVGQSLADLTPLFLTVRESSGRCRISQRALGRSQRTASQHMEGCMCLKAKSFITDFPKSTKCVEVRLMMARPTCGSAEGIWNLQLSNLVIF